MYISEVAINTVVQRPINNWAIVPKGVYSLKQQMNYLSKYSYPDDNNQSTAPSHLFSILNISKFCFH